jgi:hypothetical protein
MNRQPSQHAVKIAKSAEVLAYEGLGRDAIDDFRERDQRPGRFTVRGSFLELSGSQETTHQGGGSPLPAVS